MQRAVCGLLSTIIVFVAIHASSHPCGLAAASVNIKLSSTLCPTLAFLLQILLDMEEDGPLPKNLQLKKKALQEALQASVRKGKVRVRGANGAESPNKRLGHNEQAGAQKGWGMVTGA